MLTWQRQFLDVALAIYPGCTEFENTFEKSLWRTFLIVSLWRWSRGVLRVGKNNALALLREGCVV
jgi:hypothetical protein